MTKPTEKNHTIPEAEWRKIRRIVDRHTAYEKTIAIYKAERRVLKAVNDWYRRRSQGTTITGWALEDVMRDLKALGWKPEEESDE